MKLCIADPPYLFRAVRWYGDGGRGHGYGVGQADIHPQAHLWDDPKRHQQLVFEIERDFDGWAIAMTVHSLSVYLEALDTHSRDGIRVCVWHKTNAVPSGSRITNMWEPVLIKVPAARRQRIKGLQMQDVMACPCEQGFVGAKPAKWTRWILDLLGYQSETDTVLDLFPGSGAVGKELAQCRLL